MKFLVNCCFDRRFSLKQINSLSPIFGLVFNRFMVIIALALKLFNFVGIHWTSIADVDPENSGKRLINKNEIFPNGWPQLSLELDIFLKIMF